MKQIHLYINKVIKLELFYDNLLKSFTILNPRGNKVITVKSQLTEL